MLLGTSCFIITGTSVSVLQSSSLSSLIRLAIVKAFFLGFSVSVNMRGCGPGLVEAGDTLVVAEILGGTAPAPGCLGEV